MSFFSKLFGLGHTKPEPPQSTSQQFQTKLSTEYKLPLKSNPSASTNQVPEIVAKYRETYQGKSLKELNDMYYEIMGELTAAEKNEDINLLLKHCQVSLGLLEPLIEYNKKEYGSFEIKTIPALDKALIYFAINNNIGQLKNIQDIVYYFKELDTFKEKVNLAFVRRDISAKIYQYVKGNSNCLQIDLKKYLDFDDNGLISETLNYMAKVGKLTINKHGSKTILAIK